MQQASPAKQVQDEQQALLFKLPSASCGRAKNESADPPDENRRFTGPIDQ